MKYLRSLQSWVTALPEKALRLLEDARSALLREWVVLILGTALAAVMAHSVDKAHWVTGSTIITTALFLGWLFGTLLAYSRFSGLFAILATGLLSVTITGNLVGEVATSLFTWLKSPFWPAVENLHLRLVAFWLRVSGWVASLQQGDSIRDTGLFDLLFGILAWWTLAWLAWWALRKHQALVGLLPAAFLMAVNFHLSRQPRFSLAVGLGIALLLVACSAYSKRRADWVRREVDYPEDVALDWSGWAVLAALLVTSFTLLTPYVGTREGLQVLSEMLEKSRSRMSQRAEQAFGGVNPPTAPEGKGAGGTPYVQPPDLADLGNPPPTGNTTVFWVGLDDPAPLPEELVQGSASLDAAPKHYWRSQIFTAYNGRGWESAPPGEVLVGPPLPEEVPVDLTVPGRYRLTQTFEMEARHTGVLFSVNQPISVSPDTLLRSLSGQDSHLVEGYGQSYQVVSLATHVTIAELTAAGTDYPPEITAAYLQLPAELPGRVTRLAHEIAAGAPTPYQAATRIQDYLRANYDYDLTISAAPPNRDAVDIFLFDEPRGFCSQYASAMVVLLRSVGVPARVVAGYAMGDYDFNRGMYRVPVSAAHAWVEVYFPGYDWVEFEPTAAFNPIVYPAGQTALPELAEQPGETVAQPGRLSSAWLWLLLPLLLIAGAAGILYWNGFLCLRKLDTAHQTAVLYNRVRRRLVQGGLVGPASQTPSEYLEAVTLHLSSYPRLEQLVEETTRLYCQAEYSPRPPAPAEVRNAQRNWRLSFFDWARWILTS
ncbi:MAG: DUF4129 domain-containing protein [Anaerolineaceae bacterium]|nr:DUF4129 domain-containing protein [Anaerolineaceae bacterium]